MAFSYSSGINFQMPTFADANPWASAMSTIQGIQQNALSNQAQQIRNQTLGPTLQQQLQALQLENKKNSDLLPFVTPQAQADLQAAQLANQRSSATLPYAGPQAKAELDQTQAATGLTNQQSRYFPFTTAIEAQNAINKQNQLNESMGRFGAAYQLKQSLDAMSPPARATWIQGNQQQYNQMLADIANGLNTQQQNFSILTPQLLSKFGFNPTTNLSANNRVSTNDNLSNDKVNELPNVSNQINKIKNTKASSVLPFQSTQQLASLTAKANAMAANKALAPADINDRFQTGKALENFLNSQSAQDSMNLMSQYSGMLGKAESEVAKLVNPETAAKLQSAQVSFPKLAAGSANKLEAYHGTNTAMGQAQKLFQLAHDTFPNDPKAGLEYFKEGYKLFQDETNSIQPLAEPITTVLGKSTTPFGGAESNSNISYTPPVFNSKADYDKWIKTAPQQDVENYRNYISSKGGK